MKLRILVCFACLAVACSDAPGGGVAEGVPDMGVDAGADLPAEPFCGDGNTDDGEDCDGGPDCRDDCTLQRCGDGILDDGEACDGGDDCREDCTSILCGDNVLDDGEECDDGDENSDERADACRMDCREARCGDGTIDADETCDDGPGNSDEAPDACRSTCVEAGCGDGVRDQGEACDEGEGNSDVAPDGCRLNCALAGCGDAVLDEGEDCDDGAENADVPDACRLDCSAPTCGDGIIDTDEQCDDAEDNADDVPGACRTTCRNAGCGDGVVDEGEGCDDGDDNGDTPDACRDDCTPARCGDGVVDDGEDCDDGDDNDDELRDACRLDCRPARCGDGVLDTDEGCDEGLANSDIDADACRLNCEPADCGDGVVDEGETCDNGLANDDETPDACRLDCQPARCGDGVQDQGEVCDDGNDEDGDGCTACQPDTCAVDGDCHDANACTDDRCERGRCVNDDVDNDTPCSDGRFCTDADACVDGVCRGLEVTCEHLDEECRVGTCREEDQGCVAQNLVDDTDCDDGLACTDGDRCTEGECGGLDLDCTELDGMCQVGACAEPDGCFAEDREDGVTCDDGQYCSATDACLDGVCQQEVERDVDDEIDCTVDRCDEEANAAVHEPDDSLCADANLCNGAETCDAERGCVGGEAIVCPQPDDPCRATRCDPDTGACVEGPAPDGTECDDGLFCTLTSACSEGVCVGTSDRPVDDEVDCTDDRCDEGADAVVHSPNHGLCQNDDLCDGAETCDVDRGCLAGEPVQCDDPEEACQVAVCDPDTGQCGAEDAEDGVDCDDQDPCTDSDICTGGACGGSDRDCSEANGPCALGVCDGNGDCVPEPLDNGTGCDDQEFCTTGDQCLDGVCEGTPRSCGELDVGCAVGVCDEELNRCVAQALDVGEVCNDGIVCTTDDRCQGDGRCAGSLVQECVDSSCDDPQPLLDVLDIPVATLNLNVTLSGEPLPARNTTSDTAIFYLRARDTGALHDLHHFWYNPNGPHTTQARSIVPGIYDLVFRRDYDFTYGIVDDNPSSDLIPNGFRVLQEEVVIGAGHNELTVDLPVAMLTATVTLDGEPLPDRNNTSDTGILYLRAHDTGALHDLHHFWYNPNGPHTTQARSVVPGRYDLLYRRDYDFTYSIVDDNPAGDLIPNGFRVLRENLDIVAGHNEVVAELETAQLSVSMTLGGQALPVRNNTSDTSILYLRAHDTGALHDIKHVWYNPNGPHTTDATSVLPGTYDLLYRRDYDFTYKIVDDNPSGDLFPNGFRVLQTDVELVAGPNSLSVDVPVGDLEVNVTLGGQALPVRNNTSDTTILYLRAHDTGALHDIKHIWYNPNGPHMTQAQSVVPGMYDLLYRRDYDFTYKIVDDNPSGDLFPNGFRVLQTNVEIVPGANVINADIPVASLTVGVTLGGAALPVRNNTSDTSILYLRSEDTGALHDIKHVWYNPNGPHTTQATSVLPGRYDLIYRRDYDFTYKIVDDNPSGDLFPNGFIVLETGMELVAGANAFTVDIPVAPLSVGVTLAGAPLPTRNTTSDTAIFYLERLETGALHDIKHVWYNPNGPHTTEAASVTPGTYRLVYRRDFDFSYKIVDDNPSSDLIPNGFRHLGCFTVE